MINLKLNNILDKRSFNLQLDVAMATPPPPQADENKYRQIQEEEEGGAWSGVRQERSRPLDFDQCLRLTLTDRGRLASACFTSSRRPSCLSPHVGVFPVGSGQDGEGGVVVWKGGGASDGAAAVRPEGIADG